MNPLPIRTKFYSAREYHPSKTEDRILKILERSGEKGLTNGEIVRSQVAETTLAMHLRRMVGHGLVLRDGTRRYHITNIGLYHIMSRVPTEVDPTKLHAQRKKDMLTLWEETLNLQEKIYRIWILPRLDKTARLFWQTTLGTLGFFYIGALQRKDGTKVLAFKTPSIEELDQLGYLAPLSDTPSKATNSKKSNLA